MKRLLALACLALVVAGCPNESAAIAPPPPPDAGAAPVVTERKRIAVTPRGVGPIGAGAVTRAVVARVFLEGGAPGAIEETVETSDGQPVGRAYTVKRGESVDVVREAVVHADTDGQLYSIEILAPVAEVRGVTVGDLLGKALGDEPVKCARGIEERKRSVYCSRRGEPQILFRVTPKTDGDGPVPPETLRALPIDAIVWSPHAK